jgi:hypothetical protein
MIETSGRFGPNRSEAEMVATVFGALGWSPVGMTVLAHWHGYEGPLRLVDWRLFWAPLRDAIWTHLQGSKELWDGYTDLCEVLGFEDPATLGLPVDHVKYARPWTGDRMELNLIRQVANSEIDAALMLEDKEGPFVQLLEAKWEDDLQRGKGRHGLNQVQRQVMLAQWVARHYHARVQLTYVGANSQQINNFAMLLHPGYALEPVWRRVRARRWRTVASAHAVGSRCSNRSRASARMTRFWCTRRHISRGGSMLGRR